MLCLNQLCLCLNRRKATFGVSCATVLWFQGVTILLCSGKMQVSNDAAYEHNNHLNIPHYKTGRAASFVQFQPVSLQLVLVEATHPLLVQLQQLLRDLGRVDGHPQALDIELRDDVFQNLLQRQATGRPVPGSGRNGVLQDGPPQGGQLRGVEKKREGW